MLTLRRLAGWLGPFGGDLSRESILDARRQKWHGDESSCLTKGIIDLEIPNVK